MITEAQPYLSGDFNIEEASNYPLLICLREKDFDYAIVGNDALLAWGSNLPLTELDSPKYLAGAEEISYNKVVIGLMANSFTLLPKALSGDENLKNASRFLPDAENVRTFNQDLDNENELLFSFSESTIQQASTAYKDSKLTFYHKCWLAALAKKASYGNNFYIDIQGNTLYVANINEGRLRFYNSFADIAGTDLVYFVSLVLNELGIANEEASILMSGTVTTGDSQVSLLRQYFSHVELNKSSSPGFIPAEAESQQLLGLIALQSCVL